MKGKAIESCSNFQHFIVENINLLECKLFHNIQMCDCHMSNFIMVRSIKKYSSFKDILKILVTSEDNTWNMPKFHDSHAFLTN